MERARWDHDGVSLVVVPSRGPTLAAVVPVCISVGMIGVAMAASVTTMMLPGLESTVTTTLSMGLALGSPAPLWLTARLSSPTEVAARYTGVTIGRRHIPRERILGADHRDGVVHLLLDDGSIVRTPSIDPAVAEAIRSAFARPGDLFAETRAARMLEGVREPVAMGRIRP